MKKQYYINRINEDLKEIIATHIGLRQLRDLTALTLTKIFDKYDCRGIKVKEIDDYYKLGNKRFKKALLEEIHCYLFNFKNLIDFKNQSLDYLTTCVRLIDRQLEGKIKHHFNDTEQTLKNTKNVINSIVYHLNGFNDMILCKFQDDIKSMLSYVSELVANDLNINYYVKIHIENMRDRLDKLNMMSVDYYIF